MTERLCIFVQFDPHGGLPAHVRIHLEHLRPLVSRLVFVSNSPMRDDAYALAQSICDRVVLRENTGWDFAAWRDALAEEQSEKWDWTILTNSSVIGPLFPLAPILEKMEAGGADFWGMNRSDEVQRHLQSWFLSFAGKATGSDAWREFWASVQDIPNKRDVIEQYELNLTAALSAAGLTWKEVTSSEDWRWRPASRFPFVARRNNDTIFAPLALVDRGVPYIKSSLFGADTRASRALVETLMERFSGFPWAQLDFPAIQAVSVR